MFLSELLVALVIGFLVTILFAAGFRRVGPWPGLLLFFLIIFLAAWAGGRWLTPIGPAAFGVFWLSFLLVGLFFALIIAAAAPPARREVEISAETPAERRNGPFDAFLGILLIALAVAIVLSYT